MKNLIIAAFVFLTISCSSKVTVIPLGNYMNMSPTTNVFVYENKAAIQKGYSEIASLSVVGGKKREKAINSLIEKAKEIGADAIILDQPRVSTGTHGIGYMQASSVSYHEHATAIVFYTHKQE